MMQAVYQQGKNENERRSAGTPQKKRIFWIDGIYGVVFGFVTRLHLMNLVTTYYPNENGWDMVRFFWPILCGLLALAFLSYLRSLTRWGWMVACWGIAVAIILLEPQMCQLGWYWEGRAGIADGLLAHLLAGFLIYPLSLVFLGIPLLDLRVRYRPLVLLVIEGVGVFLIHGAQYVTPQEAGAKIMMEGFQDAVKQQTTPEQLQNWATELLERYKRGELRLQHLPDAPYGSHLPQHEIPAAVRELWIQPPTNIDILIYKEDQPCIQILWSLHGILVGDPEYRPSFQPWYLEQWQPGIYFFYIERR
jgi:hypothetical protein